MNEACNKRNHAIWWCKASLTTMLATLAIYLGALGPVTLLERKGVICTGTPISNSLVRLYSPARVFIRHGPEWTARLYAMYLQLWHHDPRLTEDILDDRD